MSKQSEPPGSVFFTILSREVGTFVRYNMMYRFLQLALARILMIFRPNHVISSRKTQEDNNMRKKLLNNNDITSISKGGVLYRPGEIPVLTKGQVEQAKLVG